MSERMDNQSSNSNQQSGFTCFADFYPYYLQEHQNRNCRRLHFVGSCLVLVIFFTALARADFWMLWLLPLAGYSFAWVGHFFFENNKPATFKYPLYSLMGDWMMFVDILRGKVSL